MAGPTGITLNAGSGGAALGVDADASYDYQIIKLGVGASGATPTQVSASAPLPVGVIDASTFTRGTTHEVAAAGVVESAAPTLTAGKAAALSMDTAGNVRVTVSNGITSGTAGTPSTQVMSVQGVSGGTAVSTVPGLTTSGGASYNNAIAPATPAVTTVKASAGNIYGVVAFNLLATPVYLKFFDAASVTLGTTAANFQFMVPGNTGGAGFVIDLPVPRSCANAVKYAVTNGIATTDNTAITANSVIIDVAYN